MVKIRYKGAQHTLLKGSTYIFCNDEIEVSKDEASYRMKIQPGMWEKVKTVDSKEATKTKLINKEVTK